jgi:hypothetical protein
MASSPRPIRQILSGDATLARWDERRRRTDALTAVVRRFLPRPLAERVRVADVDDRELMLVSDAGATAAILRQRGPDLLLALRREGWEFTGIRVRVQVRSEPAPMKKHAQTQIDRSCFRPLAGLARDLPPGPLKAALARFLRRAG